MSVTIDLFVQDVKSQVEVLTGIRRRIFGMVARRLKKFPCPTAAALDNDHHEQDGLEVQNAEPKESVRWLEPLVTGNDGGPAYDPFDYERLKYREARRLSVIAESLEP